MKKALRKVALAATLIFATSTLSFGQVPKIAWSKTYGYGKINVGHSICQAKDHGYVFVGSTDTTSTGGLFGANASITKIDSLGNIKWQNTLGYSYTNWYILKQVKSTSDGGSIIFGNYNQAKTDSTNPSITFIEEDGFILKIDSLGNTEWQKLFLPTVTGISINSMSEANNGDYLVVFNLYDLNSKNTWFIKNLIMRLDTLGNTTWQYNYLDSQFVQSIIETPDMGYILLSKKTGNGSFVSKIDSFKNIVWSKEYGDSNNWVFLRDIIKTDSNYYVITGETESNIFPGYHGGTDIVVIKIDSSGKNSWQKCFGGGSADMIPRAIKNNKEELVISFESSSNNGDILNNPDTILANTVVFSIDILTSNIIWQTTLGSTGSDIIYEFFQNLNNEYILAGFTTSDDSSKHQGDSTWITDTWIVKLSIPTILASHDLQFIASLQKDIVKLVWNSKANQQYEIQRSTDAKHWENFSQTSNSSFDDTHPLYGVSYYRLKALEKDGTFSYSNIEKIFYQFHTLRVFPTIVQSTCTISGIKSGEKVQVYNAVGVLLFSKISLGSSMDVDLSNAPKGMYVIVVNNFSTKVLKQ